jgi:hypothetical protein
MSHRCLCDDCRRLECPRTAEIVQLTGENMTLRKEAEAQAKNYAELGRHYEALESQNVKYRAEKTGGVFDINAHAARLAAMPESERAEYDRVVREFYKRLEGEPVK